MYEEMISEKDSQLTQTKDRLLKKEQEITEQMNKIWGLEQQVDNLRRERDRLLEVSKNLRISMNKLEKQQIFQSIKISEDFKNNPQSSFSNYASQPENKLLEFS